MAAAGHHPVFARLYASRSEVEEPAQAAHRAALLSGLTGRVLEVGCGNGLNFAHYPPAVTEVVAVEPEPYLRRLAARRAEARPGGRVRVVAGTATDLPPEAAGPFDAVVFSLVLCSVPDPGAALDAARERLAPGGELRAYEHVVGAGGLGRRQRLVAPLWSLAAGGCRPDRDTEAAIAARFGIEDVERFDSCVGPRWIEGLVAPRILVRARSGPVRGGPGG